MIRIYEVETETEDGRPYSSYRVAARTFEQAVAKVQKTQIDPYKVDDGRYAERIAAVHVLASEGS